MSFLRMAHSRRRLSAKRRRCQRSAVVDALAEHQRIYRRFRMVRGRAVPDDRNHSDDARRAHRGRRTDAARDGRSEAGRVPVFGGTRGCNCLSRIATDDSEIDDAVEFELEPTDIVDGKAYQFNVVAALTMTGEYEFSALLQSSHLDREFRATAESRTTMIEIASPATMLWFVIGGMVAVAVAGLGFIGTPCAVPKRAVWQPLPHGFGR